MSLISKKAITLQPLAHSSAMYLYLKEESLHPLYSDGMIEPGRQDYN